MTDKTTPASISFIDDPMAPEFFAAKHAGLYIHSGNIHISFEAPRVNHENNPGVINRVVMCRIVIPIGGAADLAINLTSFLQSQGLDPLAKPAATTVQ